MKSYLYILKDHDNQFYIGSTNNLKRRMSQHKAKHTQTTARMKSPILAFVQEYDSLEIVRKIERKLKRLKRKDYIQKIINDGYIRMNMPQ